VVYLRILSHFLKKPVFELYKLPQFPLTKYGVFARGNVFSSNLGKKDEDLLNDLIKEIKLHENIVNKVELIKNQKKEKDDVITIDVYYRLPPDKEPISSEYAEMLLYILNFTRTLNVLWSISKKNIELLDAEESMIPMYFGVHIGIKSDEALEIALRGAKYSPTHIALSHQAHAHARAVESRIFFSRSSDVRLGSDNSEGTQVHKAYPIRAFFSFIYFGLIKRFVNTINLDSTIKAFRVYPTTLLGTEIATTFLYKGDCTSSLRIASETLAIDKHHPTAWHIVATSHANLARQ